MDLSKYEKIESGFVEAITLMRQGKTVTASNGREYVIRGDEKIYYINGGVMIGSVNSYNDFVGMTWYIPKPFDVRQAMRDKPDEWVGAYHGDLKQIEQPCGVKVGFDPERAMVVKAHHSFNGKPSNVIFHADRLHAYVPSPRELNHCIPIEEVPDDRG